MIKIVRRRLTSLKELNTIKVEEASSNTPVVIITIKPTFNFDLSFFSNINFSILGFKFPIDSTRVFISSFLSS